MSLLPYSLANLSRFRHGLIIALASLLWFSTLHADTTWVAGEVYGTWTREGNPYLVTDTLIVPLDSTLNIQPGVEIWFQDQEIRRTPILVHGRLRAVGQEGDSIYFLSPIAPFGSILNENTPSTEIKLEYCVLDSLYYSIRSEHGSLVAKHSKIHSRTGPILTQFQIDTIQHCSLYATNNLPAQFSDGGPSVFQYNRGVGLYASFQQMEPIIGNRALGITLEDCPWIEAYDNELRDVFLYRTTGYFHHNQINSFFEVLEANLTIEFNTFGYFTPTYRDSNAYFLAFETQGVIRQNTIYGYIELHNANFTIQQNLIATNFIPIQLSGDSSFVIDRNTLIFGGKGVEFLGYAANQTVVKNNIFQGIGAEGYGIYSIMNDNWLIQYNDFHHMMAPTYGCELDTGNIFLDPRFRGGYPPDFQLQANSPCIDAGHPSSPLDPDSTRADMGTYYYNQLIDHPPALFSPLISNVQAGAEFRYVARAIDDYGPLQFGFWNLPPWLNIEDLDWVADSAAVSGMVPMNQENFGFGVWVEDGLSQRDSQEVSVLVSQYTILAGAVTGVLTVEESPYLVVEDVTVPAGDSLRIEPGVELRFQRAQFYSQPNFIVRGTLYAVGTSQDSIRFVPEFEDSIITGWRGIWFRGSSQDTSAIEYAYILWAHYGIEADSQATISVKHTRIINTNWGIRALNNSWIEIDSCLYSGTYSSFTGCFIFARDASADISNCYSVYSDTAHTIQDGMHIYFYSNSRGSVQACTFLNGSRCSFDFSSRVDFLDNTLLKVHEGIYVYNGSSGIIANNRISGGDGIHTGVADSLLIMNNIFYDASMGIDIYGSADQIFVKNNIFLGDSIGIRGQYTPGPFANISYNDFYDNQINFEDCAPDTTNIFLNPMVQDTIEFRLSLGSPCIDTGDPDPFFNDVDSTRNDIGCWGGPWGESYPYVFIQTPNPKPLPLDFALLPPYPNPFNSVLIIPFTIPIEKEVIINIYNILGQKVQEYTFPPLSPGVHRVIWNSGSCASGLYIIQLISSGKEFNQKVLLLK